MEYFVVIEGQKQGPYDLFSMIKKIKNGTVTAETLVSTVDSGNFRPATEFDEIKSLLTQQKADSQHNERHINLSLKQVLTEALDIWSRKVVEYTIGAGIILAIGFGISMALRKIQVMADFPSIISYVSSVVMVTLFSCFFYYVMISRRNQEPDIRDIAITVKKSFARLLVFSAIFSLYTLPFELGILPGLLSLGIVTFISCFLIFVPFLIQDSNLTLKDAVRVSVDRTKHMGTDNFSIIVALAALNLAVAIVPAMISPNLFVFGLFVSVPITASAIAYIYDQFFA